MLKLKLDTPRGPLLVLGLSHKNLEKLREGKPIAFELEPFGMNGAIMIHAGETEEIMLDEFVENGYVELKAADAMKRAMRERDGRG